MISIHNRNKLKAFDLLSRATDIVIAEDDDASTRLVRIHLNGAVPKEPTQTRVRAPVNQNPCFASVPNLRHLTPAPTTAELMSPSRSHVSWASAFAPQQTAPAPTPAPTPSNDLDEKHVEVTSAPTPTPTPTPSSAPTSTPAPTPTPPPTPARASRKRSASDRKSEDVPIDLSNDDADSEDDLPLPELARRLQSRESDECCRDGRCTRWRPLQMSRDRVVKALTEKYSCEYLRVACRLHKRARSSKYAGGGRLSSNAKRPMARLLVTHLGDAALNDSDLFRNYR